MLAIDRPYVVNTSFDYNFLKVYHGDSKPLDFVANGWTISNITSWQAGGNLQAINSPNFGLSLSYTDLPAGYGPSANIGSATYFGTDALDTGYADHHLQSGCEPGSESACQRSVLHRSGFRHERTSRLPVPECCVVL